MGDTVLAGQRLSGWDRPRALARTFLFLLLAVTAAPSAEVVFQGKLKNFRFPDYYPASPPGSTNQALKTLLSGVEAQQLPGGRVLINGLKIESNREDGRREVEVTAADCVFDIRTRQAWGTGRLRASSSTGLYAIEGNGFTWSQTNGVLIISNDVTTVLHRGLFASRFGQVDELTNAAPAKTGDADTNVVRITSDRCVFDNQSNCVTQTGHVTVDDPQMTLQCGLLKVLVSPQKRLQEIVADEAVGIVNKADGSRVSAGRAVYALDQGREVITLSGQPTWRDKDARVEVRAGEFIFDRSDGVMRGKGGTAMWLPRGSISQPDLLTGKPLKSMTNPPANRLETNYILITSETLGLKLPPAGSTGRVATAEGKVVISSPADNMRATGDKAVYREESGLLDLAGNARWESEGRLLTADTLTMDRTNRAFSARQKVLLVLPLRQYAQAGGLGVSTNRPTPTNLVLEVLSERLDYRTNKLVFSGPKVVAKVYEGKELRGLVTCGELTARLGERLEDVVAEKHVVAEHYPKTAAPGKGATNLLSCETLTATFAADGQTVSVVASENVQAARLEQRGAAAKATVSEVTCTNLTVLAAPKTGRVIRVNARGHVEATQGDKLVRGEEAEYTDKEDQLVVTGHPYAEFADGRLKNAKVLIWDRKTGVFKGRGPYRLEYEKPKGQTNTTKWLKLKP